MKHIKLLIIDVDGTLTDGKIYMGENDEIMKAFDVKDGYGIAHILPKLGIVPVIITGRESEIVANRAAELGISEVYQGVFDKLDTLKTVAEKYECSPDNLAYIGDDINDLPCIEYCGVEPQAAEAPKEQPTPEQQTVTFVQLRSRLSEISRSGKTAEVKELIAKYGASKLSDIAESDYAAVLAEAEGL